MKWCPDVFRIQGAFNMRDLGSSNKEDVNRYVVSSNDTSRQGKFRRLSSSEQDLPIPIEEFDEEVLKLAKIAGRIKDRGTMQENR